MINKEDIERIARMGGARAWQQEKHYIQTLILKSLYSKFGNKLIFKGGTALWFFHGLKRYSEDLDFTANGELDVQALSRHISDDLAAIGVENKVKILENNKRSISLRIGAKGPLYDGEISLCYVRVEISLRENVLLPYDELEFSPPYSDITPFSVAVMNLKEISTEKIRALTKREKARDLYDLFHILKSDAIPDEKLIKEKLIYSGDEFSYAEFEKAVNAKKDIWESELSNFIFGKFPSFKEASESVLRAIKK